MIKDFNEKFSEYAIYLPSLQTGYAAAAGMPTNQHKRKWQIEEERELSKNFKSSDLDFLSGKSRLWTSKYVLYSSGLFTSDSITSDYDLIRDRKRGESIVIGDSGGFQLGRGSINNSNEKKHFDRYVDNPDFQFAKWGQSGFRERTLRWLDKYADYGMSLDMALWFGYESEPNKLGAKSHFRKLTFRQLIELTQDNLKYFIDNRGKYYGNGFKILNVLHEADEASGELWYQAVRDYSDHCSGWAYGSNTKRSLYNSVFWTLRLLDDQKLDNAEWIHLLGRSPPINSIIYTALQKGIRSTGNTQICISYDSSTASQTAGQKSEMIHYPNFTKDYDTWTVSKNKSMIEQDLRVARGVRHEDFPTQSILSPLYELDDLLVKKQLYTKTLMDTLSYQLLTNHNMWAMCGMATESCDLIWGENQDTSKVPQDLVGAASLIEELFKDGNRDQILAELKVLLARIEDKTDNEIEDEDR